MTQDNKRFDTDAAWDSLLSTTRTLGVDLQIDMSDLSNSLSEHPGAFAYWSALCTDAQGAFDDAKDCLALTKASVASDFRQKAYGRDRRVTESEIEHSVLRSERYIGALSAYRKAKQDLERLKVVVRSLEQKLQSMIAIAANERSMLRTVDPTVRNVGERMTPGYTQFESRPPTKTRPVRIPPTPLPKAVNGSSLSKKEAPYHMLSPEEQMRRDYEEQLTESSRKM